MQADQGQGGIVVSYCVSWLFATILEMKALVSPGWSVLNSASTLDPSIAMLEGVEANGQSVARSAKLCLTGNFSGTNVPIGYFKPGLFPFPGSIMLSTAYRYTVWAKCGARWAASATTDVWITH